jgi:cation transporter-like permease
MLSLTSGLVVGVSGGLIGEVFFDANFWQVCVLGVAAMIGVGLIAYPTMAALTVVIRKMGVDADNIIGPVETGFTDMLTIIAVSLLVRIFV